MTVIDPRLPIIVLAGGASRRMGTDKRLVDIDGVPMLQRVLDRVAGASRVVIVIDPSRPLPDALVRGDGRTVVPDLRPDAGPLAGLEAGLAALASDPAALVVGADMPWIEPAVLGLVAERLTAQPDADLACLAFDGRRQPFPIACRPVLLLRRVTRLLDTGERRLRRLLDAAPVVAIDEVTWRRLDPAGGSVRDVDTPADLARAG